MTHLLDSGPPQPKLGPREGPSSVLITQGMCLEKHAHKVSPGNVAEGSVHHLRDGTLLRDDLAATTWWTPRVLDVVHSDLYEVPI